MSERATISDSDEGKKVVNARSENIGRVVEVEGGTAHVDPDPDLTDTVKSKLGWGESDEETYRLQASRIDTVTEDEVRLESTPNERARHSASVLQPAVPPRPGHRVAELADSLEPRSDRSRR